MYKLNKNIVGGIILSFLFHVVFTEESKFLTEFKNPVKIGGGEFAVVFRAENCSDVSFIFYSIIHIFAFALLSLSVSQQLKIVFKCYKRRI
jgi:hypothetical protein